MSVAVDGRPAPLLLDRSTGLVAVDVPAGPHVASWRWRPFAPLVAFRWLSGLTLLGVLLLLGLPDAGLPGAVSSGPRGRLALPPRHAAYRRIAIPAPERLILSIVAPVFNEVGNLEPLVREIEEVRASLSGESELILVDDGSRDGSWDRHPRTGDRSSLAPRSPVPREPGPDRGDGRRDRARERRLIAFLDADLQNDPHDLPGMLATILEGRADVVCGWRAHRKDRTVSRIVPSLVANLLITHALGLRLHDVGCTLKVFRRVYLENVELYGEMHRFIPAYCAAQGGRIVEVEVNHRPRLHGESKYGLSRVYKVLIDLLTVKMLNTYGSKPAYFFGKLGFVFFGVGTAAFLLVAWRALFLNHPESTPMVFFMLLMYVASLVCVTSGLLAEINIRVLHRVGGKRSYRIIDEVGTPGPDWRSPAGPLGAPAAGVHVRHSRHPRPARRCHGRAPRDGRSARSPGAGRREDREDTPGPRRAHAAPVIDLSDAASQPLWDAERTACIVFNGEVYNYREIRDECRRAGLELRSASDTEAIVGLYLLEGERAFGRLDGIFAFCILDARSGEAFLVRDPMGVKPLYWT